MTGRGALGPEITGHTDGGAESGGEGEARGGGEADARAGAPRGRRLRGVGWGALRFPRPEEAARPQPVPRVSPHLQAGPVWPFSSPIFRRPLVASSPPA